MTFKSESKSKVKHTVVLTLVFFSLISWFVSTTTHASSVIVVTTTADNGDNNNPTPGSLRQAIITANNTSGTDTINFNIGSGAQTIAPPTALPVITDPVIIDATTQPGFAGAPIIELTGKNTPGSTGIQINSGGSTIRGLVINRFSTGIYLTSKGNNVIAGNYVGTDLTGTVAQANANYGINVEGGNGNTFGGATAADRNLISGNGNTGLRLDASGSNTVLGNYIGTDVTGSFKLGNGNQGLRTDNATNNKIGGTGPGEGNLISGNADTGIRIGFAAAKITGNHIGTDISGTKDLGNGGGGIEIYKGTGNTISANSIAFNTRLGIDLDVDGSAPADGVTPNDPGDADTGSNNLQNYPVITSISPQANSTVIEGKLNSTANTQFHLEFFSNAQSDPTGFGEGQFYLGSTDVTTVGNDVSFNVTVPVALSGTQCIAATATDPAGNTSEFSNCVGLNLHTLQFSALDYSVNESGAQATITITRSGGSAGAVSVQYATSDGTAAAGADYTATSGTLNWADGDSSNKTFTVAITDDALNELPETINLTLSNPTGGAVIGAPATATVTINDNDPQPSLSIDDVSVKEGDSGTINATFTVTLSTVSGRAVTVTGTTADGTAKAGQDYQAVQKSLFFNPGETSKPFTVVVNGDTDFEPDELFSVFLTNPSGATISKNQGVGTIVNDDVAPSATIQFDQASYSVSESEHFKFITVSRTGDASAAASVDYQTMDGTANQRTDYTLLAGTLSFAPGETQKTLTLLITDDSYVEGDETLTLTLSNPVGATLGATSVAQITITDNDNNPNASNAIDDVQTFIRQHYHDFLNREPDPQGFAGWQNILNNCPASGKDSNGNFCDRIEVSSDFYRSPEFHDRGYFIYRFYSVGLGRIPHYQEFMEDIQRVSGFLSQQQEEDAKAQFINEFMQRTEFKQKYDQIIDAGAYVDALAATAGVTLQNRNQIVQPLQANQITRAQALRAVVESPEVDQKFHDEAFVIAQYFGYLRRDADALYVNWIQVLKQTGDYRIMVNGFMNSIEYRQRFGN